MAFPVEDKDHQVPNFFLLNPGNQRQCPGGRCIHALGNQGVCGFFIDDDFFHVNRRRRVPHGPPGRQSSNRDSVRAALGQWDHPIDRVCHHVDRRTRHGPHLGAAVKVGVPAQFSFLTHHDMTFNIQGVEGFPHRVRSLQIGFIWFTKPHPAPCGEGSSLSDPDQVKAQVW